MLKYADKIVLKIISNILEIETRDLVEIYLRIESAGAANELDLIQLFELKIPIYQAIFSLTKSRLNTQDIDAHLQVGFSDIKIILYALIEPHGLLYDEICSIPRYQFSYSESLEIKQLLRQAKLLERKDRQDILAHLRNKFRFFPSTMTKSRVRFDDVTFDNFVSTGQITIVP